VPILFLTQALNAVLLLPLLCFILGIVRDRETMGDFALGRPGSAVAVAVIGVLAVCVASLAVALAFG
jgi:Mn2+/Fe2+ NRAMP family transporter